MVKDRPEAPFIYFTNWSLHFTNIALLTSSFAMRFPDYEFTSWKSWAVLFNQLAMDANTVTTITAVFGIIPHWFEFFPWETPEDYYDQIFNVFIHTVPMIISTINYFFLTDQVGHMMDSWLVVVVASSYMIYNWLYTKETGSPIYPFLTWEAGDDFSLMVAILQPIIGFIVHISIALIT